MTGTAGAAGQAAGQGGVGRVRAAIRRQGSHPADILMRHAFSGMVASLVLAGAVMSFVYSNRRADIMFANHLGQLTPLQYSDTPSVSSEAVVNWSKIAVSEILTYNFNNVKTRLSYAQRFFTPSGWAAFKDAVREDEVLDKTVSKREFWTTVPAGAPAIGSEGVVDDVYTWYVQVPIMIYVSTGTAGATQNSITVLTIERMPTKDSLGGYAFGIARIVR